MSSVFEVASTNAVCGSPRIPCKAVVPGNAGILIFQRGYQSMLSVGFHIKDNASAIAFAYMMSNWIYA